MAIDYKKVKTLYQKGLTVKEIAKRMKCKESTLNNNTRKWKIKEEEIPIQEILPPDTSLSSKLEEGENQVITETTEKEILQVKKFYKIQMKLVRTKIKELLGEPYHEETIKEIGLLTKLIELLGKSQAVDWKVYDILEYKDVLQFEMTLKKIELDLKNGGVYERRIIKRSN